jgi:hypothetical protein
MPCPDVDSEEVGAAAQNYLGAVVGPLQVQDDAGMCTHTRRAQRRSPGSSSGSRRPKKPIPRMGPETAASKKLEVKILP